MNKFMLALTAFFSSGIGSVIKALLILILAFIVAAIAKSLVVKLLSKTKLGKVSGNDKIDQQYVSKTVDIIGKLVQLIVFLLFVPGIFDSLGMTSVSAPIIHMLDIVWAYLPHIIAAVLILWIGFYVAKLVREILVPVLNKLEVNRLQKIAGIEVSEQGQLSNTIAYIVYVLILIPVIITALEVLNIKAISDPAVAMLNMIFQYIPNIIAALVIISIGWLLAKFIGNIVTRLLAASGLDAKIDKFANIKEGKFVFSEVVGKTVQAVLVIFFIVESFSTLHLGILTKIGLAVIAYLPNVLVAIIILAICFLLSSFAGSLLTKYGHPNFSMIAKVLIYVIGIFMILNQLGIARTLVNSAFILTVAALAVAFAISFGVGGREFAKNILAKFQSKIDNPAK